MAFKRSFRRARGKLASGYRSKYEERVAAKLTERNVAFEYEPVALTFCRGVRQAKCISCGSKSVNRPAKYTPDFKLRNGSFVETKGKFTSSNRTMLQDFRKDRPEVLVRLLFQRDNFLSKKHKHTYTQWATANGYESAVGESIPEAWSI